MGASPHVRPSSGGREPTPGPARFGRFELIERIGAGGMAEVFRAAVVGPEGFRREIVVKRVLPQLSARARFTQMFVNEAKISALLTHPNIVQIFEFGESDGAYFIAMESVRGLTLRETLTKLRTQERLMPVVAAAEITREVLVALDYAHSLRDADGRRLEIVHRDVSPSNVMLADSGAVKVLDFGIARAADLMSDDEGQVVKGKISYLAPEQISCGDIDARVDVFALGCVLHEILTGRVMFRAQNDLQKKIDLLAQSSPPPSAWNSDVPPALDAIVARATARHPDARYPTAADMLADVDNYLSSFRSSSRAVLRLVRSLSDGTRDEDTAQPTLQPTLPTPAAPVPRAASSTATTQPAKLLAAEAAERRAQQERADRLDEAHSSSGGRGEIVGAGTHVRSLIGAAAAERTRVARSIWQRRVLLVGAAVLGLGALGGVVVGARSLWGRVSRPAVGVAKANAAPQEFVLVTFMSTPSGARIIDAGGRAIGNTPVTLPITPSRIAVPFRFEKDGFRPTTSSIIADGDKTIDVELKVLRKVEKPARKPAPTKRGARGR
ncbi:MAG: serine/threonine-protein kinase [Bacteroidota bacterium]